MVKPRQKRVEEAKEALNLALESLQEKQASLAKVCKKLDMSHEELHNVFPPIGVLETW